MFTKIVRALYKMGETPREPPKVRVVEDRRYKKRKRVAVILSHLVCNCVCTLSYINGSCQWPCMRWWRDEVAEIVLVVYSCEQNVMMSVMHQCRYKLDRMWTCEMQCKYLMVILYYTIEAIVMLAQFSMRWDGILLSSVQLAPVIV